MEIQIHAEKKILIAGSSGLIGTQLVAFLDTGGHDVYRLVRRKVRTTSRLNGIPIMELSTQAT